MNSAKIPTILGVAVLLVGVVVGVLLIQQDTVFRLGASPDTTPKDVRITNVVATSFTVSWHTKKKTIGFVSWGDSQDFGKTSRSNGTLPTYSHHVDVENVVPGEEYFFVINSEGDEHDNLGSPWEITTAPNILLPRQGPIISGVVKTVSGAPANDAIVYITSSGITPLSAQVTNNGEWLYPLSGALSFSLGAYAQVTAETFVELYVQAGGEGMSTARALIGNINPAPEMVLGQSYDFTTDNPLNQSSKTDIVAPSGSQSSGDENGVTLDSLDDGETIFTTDPEFFGEGPAGGSITVTVESENSVTQDVQVLGDGSWKWSPSLSLEEGAHNITVSWIDSRGILQSIQRSFTVFASDDDPSFESTPSASTNAPIPTASPAASSTSTPTPTTTSTPASSPSSTSTPTPTPTSSPSPTPTPTLALATPTSTPAVNLPSAGVIAPTVIGMFAGVALLIGSLLIAL